MKKPCLLLFYLTALVLFIYPSTSIAQRLASLDTCESVKEAGTEPVNITDNFNISVPEIHAVAVIDDIKAGAVVKGVWVAVDAIQTPNYEIASTEIEIKQNGSTRVHFSLSQPAKGWPAGNYRIDLYVDNQLIAPKPFSITGAAASKPGAAFDFGPVRRNDQRLWTVLVYLDGDNNLESAALRDIDEMERSLPDKLVEIIVLLDRAQGFSEEQGDWTDARVFRIRPDQNPGIHSETIASPGELNMGDPTVLQEFLTSGIKTFPAKRYALVLWNHGGGWATHITDDQAPGAEGEFDKLTLPELRNALTNTLRATQLKKLDVVGFDMCLMAQLETAYELESLADVVVGSEAIEPNEGWPYDAIIPLLAKKELSTHGVAKRIVEAYDNHYRPRQEPIATQSAFDLSKVAQLKTAFDAFLTKIEPNLPQFWGQLTRTLFFSENYGDLADVRRGPNGLLSVDLGDAVKNLTGVMPEISSSAEYSGLRSALKNFIIATKSSPIHEKSQGVALYAPFQKNLFNEEYRLTRFAKESRWPDVLQKLYDVQAQHPSKPQIAGIETVSLLRQEKVPDVIQLGQDGFAFTFEGNNLLWASAWLGERDTSANQTLIFQKSLVRRESEEEGPLVTEKTREELLKAYGYSDGRHNVGFRFDATRRMVSNGKQSFLATMDETDIENLNSHFITAPAVYEHPDVGKLFAVIYFNWQWRAVALTLEVPQKDGSFVYVQIEPKPDADIHLLLEALADDGKRKYIKSGTTKWNEGLFLTLDLVPPGDYEVNLALESLAGVSNLARHRFTVSARSDDLLKGIENAPEELILENFIGEWEYIDAAKWFRDGVMQSIGAFAKYEAHPKYNQNLRKTIYKPKGKNMFPNLDMVEVINTDGLPHLRQYVLDRDGIPKRDFGYRMSLPQFDFKDGRYFLLSMDLATGELGVMVKRSGPTPKLKTPPESAPSSMEKPETTPLPPAAPNDLTGVWQSAADGIAIAFQGNQWAYYEDGQLEDGGIFQIQGNQIFAKSLSSGDEMIFLFELRGKQLLLQDPFGEVYQLKWVQ